MLETYLNYDLDDGCDWYLAKTKPLCEKLAVKAVESIGCSAFLPIVRMVTSGHLEKDVCIFPGYLFIKSGTYHSELPDIRSISFLSGWVKFDGLVSKIPNQVISDLDLYVKELNGDGGLWSRYQKDEIVDVFIAGFAVKAKIIESPSSPYNSALILMKFMGRDITTSVEWKYINSDSVSLIKHKVPRRTRGKGRVIKDNTTFNYSVVR
tara:strand:+ start:1197 stop:1820 length:624 start_codon:yes stop_codon:yes gene_type:complete